MAEYLQVEVAYARPDKAFCIPVEVPAGATVAEAIHVSGILSQCPEIDLGVNRTGIFGRLCEAGERVNSGDRVEIYRPLQVDPKEARRRRADKRQRTRQDNGTG